MPIEFDFYFDYASPAGYLAYKRLPGIVERTGVPVNYRPILLGAVMKKTGNIPPFAIPSKDKWFFEDLARWAQRHGAPFRKNPFFPVNSLILMRAAIAMRRANRLLDYSDVVYKALWEDGKNLGDIEIVSEVLGAAGFDVPALFAASDDPEVKEELKNDTDAAVARGVFGVPTCFVNGEQHFGQDRLDFVEEALMRVKA